MPLICILLLLLTAPLLTAQERISGVVNHYAAVADIDYCTNALMITSRINLQPGDRALLIQMKGATVDRSYSEKFGEVTAYNSAGRYEIVTVRSVTGSTVVLELTLLNRYETAGLVQLVTIPRFGDAVVDSVLTASNWNGIKGGILALEVEGTLTLHADIDVTGKGFRGGLRSINRDTLTDSFRVAEYYRGVAGEKGEAIARPIKNMEAGRAAIGNGGGGGNAHNAGGGGGSNAGGGGEGGGEGGWGYDLPIGGLGGWSLGRGHDSGRVIAGGGGGGGHQNNWSATDGGPGGGIVFIIASRIEGNGYRIVASGDSAYPAGNDGAGGGGGGGSIVLDVGSFQGAISLVTRGGNGGNNHSNGTDWAWAPPGGGGGGGLIVTTRASITGATKLDFAGGAEGRIINTNSQKHGQTFEAKPGGRGIYRAGWKLVHSSSPFVRIAVDAGPDITVCAGWPGAAIGTTSIGGMPPYSYRWTPSEGLSSDTVASPVAGPDSTTRYYVRITDALGCSRIDSVVVNVLDTPLRLLSPLLDGVRDVDTQIVRSSFCEQILLENSGPDTLTIPSMTLDRNIEFSIPPSQFPFILAPGERRALSICYAPTALRIDRDTLGFFGLCQYRLPLKGRGAIGLLSGNDDCGIGMEVRVVADTLYRLQASAPWPNPATSTISLPVIESIPTGMSNAPLRATLYDLNGTAVSTGHYQTLRTIQREGALDRSGVVIFDCGDLSSGLYYITLETANGVESWGVLVGR